MYFKNYIFHINTFVIKLLNYLKSKLYLCVILLLAVNCDLVHATQNYNFHFQSWLKRRLLYYVASNCKKKKKIGPLLFVTNIQKYIMAKIISSIFLLAHGFPMVNYWYNSFNLFVINIHIFSLYYNTSCFATTLA